jgi:hypothetical protein
MLRYIELALSAAILAGVLTLLALTSEPGDATRKPQDVIPMSTVTWGGVKASVPEPIMREMGLKPGQEIDDETAKRIVKYFRLEAKKSGR